MIGTLYRYPHPYDPDKFIYVGQGPKRDSSHRSGRSSFGRRFKRDFPGVELLQPIRERVEVSTQSELNEEETIWIFRYHTWRGYVDGMNLVLPGPQDYKKAGEIGGLITGLINGQKLFERKAGIFARTKEKMYEDARKGGQAGKGISKNVVQLAALRTSEHQQEAGRKSASVQGHKKLFENGRKGGRIGGPIGGRKTASIPGHMVRAAHVRWHVKRNKSNLGCSFCREEAGAVI